MLTHSTQDKKEYALKRGNTVVAIAKKCQKGFDWEGQSFPTMKALKKALTPLFPEPPAKQKMPTIKDAMRQCAMSHSGLYVHLKAAREYHPYLRKEQIGFFLIRQHHEAIATWKGKPHWQSAVECSERWLEKNPWPFKVKEVDWEASERMGRPIYKQDSVSVN